MEIIFLWTRDYEPFDENSFSFNGEFNVSFTKDEEKKTIYVDIVKNDSFPSNFFGDDIENISCIIGKNGSGKTRIFQLLEAIKTDQWYSINDYILITYSKERAEFDIRHNLNKESEGLTPHQVLRGDEKYKFKNNLPEGYKISTEGYSQKAQVVYYSPILDLKNHPIRVDNKPIVDVSTDFLIITDKDSNKEDIQDLLATHRFKNVERQFDFVTKFKDQFDINDFFKLPNALDVSCLESRYDESWAWNLSQSAKEIREYFIGDNSAKKRGVILERIHEIGGLEYDLKEKGKPNDKAFLDLHMEKVRLSFLSSFVSHYFTSWNTDNHWRRKDIGIKPEAFVDLNAWEACIVFLEKEKWTKDNGVLGVLLLKKLDEFLQLVNADYFPSGSRSISTMNHTIVEELINLQFRYIPTLRNYEGPNSSPDIFQIDWRNLSSGEKAFLDLFSRLNYANTLLREKDVDRYGDDHSNTEWLYLLIDEGEIGFHPNWQKSFVSLLHHMTPFIFPDLKIQIILASHSPFIASDVPIQNIVFLDKVEGKVLVNNEIKFKNSFAANIHTLFADGFFLSGGLIGDFAKDKIQKVIDWLNNKKSDMGLSDNMKKTIDLVGEPIIRNKLTDMFHEKIGFNVKLDIVERELKRLEDLKVKLLKEEDDVKP